MSEQMGTKNDDCFYFTYVGVVCDEKNEDGKIE